MMLLRVNCLIIYFRMLLKPKFSKWYIELEPTGTLRGPILIVLGTSSFNDYRIGWIRYYKIDKMKCMRIYSSS